MTSPPPAPVGWYPDPAGGTGQKFWDGTAWHDSPPAAEPNPDRDPGPPARRPLSRDVKIIILVAVGFLVLIISAAIGGDADDNHESTSAPTTAPTSISPTTVSAVVTEPTRPAGVSFHTEGVVLFAQFDIHDNFTKGMIRSGAQRQTVDILRYARGAYPDAATVVVQGSFPMKDAYGNTSNTIILNARYSQETLRQINFAGVNPDRIWDIRDGGMVHPELQD